MKWIVADAEASGVAALRSALGISLPAARVLCARGLGNAAEARRFLAPSTADLHDPFLLADMQMAAARLARAIERKEPILLYGDYDVDGVTSTALLLEVLNSLGWNSQREGFAWGADLMRYSSRYGLLGSALLLP